MANTDQAYGQSNNRSHRSAFTLIEILMVIVLMSLLAATAMLMVRLPLANAHRGHAVSQLKLLDATARDRALNGQMVRLRIDTDRSIGRLVDNKGRDLIPSVSLGPMATSGVSATAERHLTVLGSDSQNAGTQNAGTQTLEYDAFGTSRTYAVRFGPSDGTDEWLLVLGATGQTYSIDQRRTVDEIIDISRHHTD